jgi:hypothetical protein
MIGATLLVGAVLHWPLLQSPFGGAFGRFLGRISFVLYLIHIPVICGFTSWMVISPLAISVEITGPYGYDSNDRARARVRCGRRDLQAGRRASDSLLPTGRLRA